MSGEEITVSSTGIPELDDILKGGIPQGHVVLLSGDSGTGKTILSMEWLFGGYRDHDDNGLYVTLTESVTAALTNVKEMSFYDEQAVDNSHIHFTDLRTTIDLLGIEEGDVNKTDIEELVDAIGELVEETDADRMVIDSITALGYLLDDMDLIRTFIFELGAMLADHDVTTMQTSEVSDDGYSVYGVEEFISDGIIKLDREEVANDFRHRLQVIKMRAKDYKSQKFPFTLSADGIKLYVTDPPLEYPAPSERVSTGISSIDSMIDGGLYRASTSLVTGPSGTGKTLLSLHFTLDGLKNGENCLYIGFEESADQLKSMAGYFGWDLSQYEDDGSLHFRCSRPTEQYPEAHLDTIRHAVEEEDIDRVVLDSLTAIRNVYPEDDFHRFVRKLTLYLKTNEVTAVLTSSSHNTSDRDEIGKSTVSTLTDNIFTLNYVETRGRLRFTISSLKTRRSRHDQALREYKVTDNGIKVGEAMTAYEGVTTGTARKVSDTRTEKLKDVFLDVLGSDGRTLFDNIVEERSSYSDILDRIDEQADEGRLSDDDAAALKEEIEHIEESESRVGDEDIKQFFK